VGKIARPVFIIIMQKNSIFCKTGIKAKFVKIHIMGAVKLLDKEIAQYVERLSIEQKEVILSVVKTFAREEAWWNNKAYLNEMDSRFKELESGKIKAISLDALESSAKQTYKRRQKNK